MRADGAGASRELARYCREGRLASRSASTSMIAFAKQLTGLPQSAWAQAIRADGSRASVPRSPRSPTASTFSAWPEGSRLIARRRQLRTRPAQLRRPRRMSPVRLPDRPAQRQRRPQARSHPPRPARSRRPHPRRRGLRPGQPAQFESFATTRSRVCSSCSPRPRRPSPNELCLADDARALEAQAAALPAASPVRTDRRHARRTTLASRATGPESGQLAAAFARLQALPAPAGLSRPAPPPTTTTPEPRRQPAREQRRRPTATARRRSRPRQPTPPPPTTPLLPDQDQNSTPARRLLPRRFRRTSAARSRWMRPPRRSWRWISPMVGVGGGSSGCGGCSLSARCGLLCVVVLDIVAPRTCSRCRRLRISSQSRHSARTVLTNRSAMAFA